MQSNRNFPDGVSNPLLNEKVATTADVFEPETVDFGVALMVTSIATCL